MVCNLGSSRFKAKGNAAAIQDLILSENCKPGRETQKKFLEFCIEMFRQALLINYETKSLVYFEPKVDKLNWRNFAPFVNGNNIHDIFKELSDAMYHVKRKRKNYFNRFIN
jgi:DNA polymerase-3 subunit delta'